jgi:hypothetical protein
MSMTDETQRITFMASLPPIQSAITLDGNGDGARIKLDIPASDAGAALLLQHHGAGKTLRVTIEFMPEVDHKRPKTRRL